MKHLMYRAVSFEDMVIAVRTPSSRQSTGFHCTGNKVDGTETITHICLFKVYFVL